MAKKYDNTFLKKFGKRVRELRKNKGFSQENFAYAVGLDRSFMGMIERGERNISLLYIKKLAEGLKIPLSELFENIK